jgi:LysR family hydrogen peroxide-inducible transcriptional activator
MLIPQFKPLAPEMPLFIEENYTENLIGLLKEGKIDLAIIALPYDLQSLQCQVVYEEPFVLALPIDHPWKNKRSIEPGEIDVKSLFLLGPGHCFRDQVIEVCPQCNNIGLEASEQLHGSSLETICHMIATGAGISILPSLAVAYHRVNGLLLTKPFRKPAPSRRVALVWRNTFTRCAAIEVVRQAILACSFEGVKLLRTASVEQR